MVGALIGLLVCQLMGEALVRAAGIAFPGPVLGMFLMLGFLVLRGRWRLRDRARITRDSADRPESDVPVDVPAGLAGVSGALLGNLSLLFVPAAVGIIRHAALMRDYGLTIGVSIVISTTAALAVTALVFQAVAKRTTPRHDQP